MAKFGRAIEQLKIENRQKIHSSIAVYCRFSIVQKIGTKFAETEGAELRHFG